MRHYAIVGLLAVTALMSLGAKASAGDLLTVSSSSQQHVFDWQTQWGTINFNTNGSDPGIDSSILAPKADIKDVVSANGTQTGTTALALIKSYNVDLNGDGIPDIITDSNGYFPTYQKANSPMTVCTTADGCYISVYLMGQTTSISGGPACDASDPSCADNIYNTITLYSQQVLAWNVVTAADFQTWAAGKPYRVLTSNPVLAVKRQSNSGNCFNEELLANNNACVKYYQYSGDFLTGTLVDLYSHADVSNTMPEYTDRFTYSAFNRDAGSNARGQVIGTNGYSHQLCPIGKPCNDQHTFKNAGTIDIQVSGFSSQDCAVPAGFKVSTAPSSRNLYAFHIENHGNASLFVPANTSKEFCSFVNAAASNRLPGVSVCGETVQYTSWTGGTCDPNSTVETCVPQQRYCQSSTGDYRDCSACINAASAANGAGWPDDWSLGCFKNVECPPVAGCPIHKGGKDRIVTLDQCLATMNNYYHNGVIPTVDDANNTLMWYQEAGFTSAKTDHNTPYKLLKYSLRDYQRDPAKIDGKISYWCEYTEKNMCLTGHICLAADSQISLADGTTKRIDEVKAGDTVFGFATPKGKLKPVKVVSITTTPKQSLLNINDKLRITPNHRVILASGKEVPASKLKVGDILLSGDGSRVKIETIESLSEDTVHNLVLAKPAIGFVADGLRVTDYKH